MKRVITLVIVIIMIFSLTGCGDTLPTITKKSVDTTPIPEFTYVSTCKDISTSISEYLSIMCFTDDGFYATYSEVVGDNTPEGIIPDYEGEYWIYENKLVFIDNNGNVKNLDSYNPIAFHENNDDQKYDYSTYSNLQSIASSSDGNLYCIEYISESWVTIDGLSQNDDEYWNNYMYHQTYYLRVLDSNGNELSHFELPLNEDEYISGSIVIDKDGNLIIVSNNSIYVFSLTGETVYSVSNNDNYIDNISSTKDGRIFITMWSSADGEKEVMKELLPNHTLSSSIALPIGAYTFYSGNDDYPLYYSSGSSLYGFNPDDGTNDKIFSWVNLDINGNMLYSLKFNDDGTINGITIDYEYSNDYYNSSRNNTNNTSFTFFTIEKKPYFEVTEKTEITLATEYLNYDVMDEVIKFNRSNDKYRIIVNDYSEYNTSDDYSAGLTKLKTEIMAGNVPDIIDFSSISPDQFASKGLLIDLYPLIDSDPDINRDDMFENVLKACEIDGKLYSTVSGFYINSVVAPKSLVGDSASWTFNEFKSIYDTMPEDCDIFYEYYSREDILRTCLNLDMNYLVNWSTGEVNFDSEEFRNIVKFSELFQETFDWDQYNENYEYESVSSRIRSGKQMLCDSYISSANDIMYLSECFSGIPYSFIGMPTETGSGNTFGKISTCFGISTKCECPDAAWNFIRYFFSEEYLESSYCIPIDKTIFDKMLNQAMTVNYQKDANGEFVLDEAGEKIPSVRYSFTNDLGELVNVYAISEEEAESLRRLVAATNKISSYDEEINNIVINQLESYYSGQKSLDDVIKLIQSEANIYVNEQR